MYNVILTFSIVILGIGDWGLGIAIPNPQSPIPKLFYFIILI